MSRLTFLFGYVIYSTIAPQSIDWSGIRAAAIALNSVRDAALRAASNLPPTERTRFVERVNKRAYRERWLDQARALSKPRDNGSLPLSKPVQSGSDSLASKLREDGESTRLDLSKATRNASKRLAELPGDDVLVRSEDLRRVVSSAAQIHAWDQEQPGSGSFGGLRVHSQQTIINVDARASHE